MSRLPGEMPNGPSGKGRSETLDLVQAPKRIFEEPSTCP